MALKAAKCSECGAELDIDESREFGFCSRCGTKYITEKIISNNTTNIEQQVNLYLGDNNFEKEKKQCEVLIMLLKNCDFTNIQSQSLKILDLNPQNQLAQIVYQCNFEIDSFCDNQYVGYNFSEEPIIEYFEQGMGYIDLEISTIFAQLLINKCVYSIFLSDCMNSILTNITHLSLSNIELYNFFEVVLKSLTNNNANNKLKSIASKNKSAAWANILLTGSAGISTSLDLISDEAKKLDRELTIIKDELWSVITDYIDNSNLPDEEKEKLYQHNKFSVSPPPTKSGCYIATAIYGSYDCPEVWVLRRYRDYKLAKSYFGRLFIKIYYKISPTIVKWFGDKLWFRKFWQSKLDKKIKKLRIKGYEDTRYEDKNWQ